MATAKGISKRVAYKKETTFGTPAGASGGQVIRRTSATFNLNKESYESAELRTDYMTADLRHGARSVDGSVSGELSAGTYSDFIGSVLARDFTNGVSATGLSLVIAASGTNFTITRAAGSFLTDNFKVGHVVRITAGTGASAANLNNNLLVIAVSALVLTVKVLSATTMVVESGITAATISATGKTTYVPKTGHTDQSYTIEQWFADIAQSEVYTGVKVGSFSMSLPATGMVTADFTMLGRDLAQTGTSAYYTSPTAAGVTGAMAAVNGALLVNGAEGACITSMDFNVERGLTATQCVGSNFASDIFVDKINVTGNFSAYFSDATFRDLFANETEATVVVALTSSNAKTADVISIVFPRVKASSFSADDQAGGLTQTLGFTALLNGNTATGLIDSVIQVQDTSLT